MKPIKFGRVVVVATAVATTTVLASSGTSHAASCTVNVYRVTFTPAGVWNIHTHRWIKDKRAGEIVTGPNGNVMNINTRNGWRKVYLADMRLAMMYPGYLRYLRCR